MNKIEKILPSLLMLLTVATSLYVRVRLSGVPLERDEGEYAHMGQLLLKGIPPYMSAYTMKLPGVALVYALCMSIFGESATGIRIGFIFVNSACTGLVYLLGKRFFTFKTAVTAAGLYALLSLSESVLGVFAHGTHLVVLFSLAGILLLERALARQQSLTVFMSGTLFGLAFLMKQHAALLILFALVFQIWLQRKDHRWLFRDGFAFLAGAAAPYLVVALWLFNAGVFDRFWFWTFQYASEYATRSSIDNGLHELFRQFKAVAASNLPIWLLAGAGLVALCRGRKSSADKRFFVGYLAVSAAMVCPGLYFRPHYFVLLLPPIALLAAFAIMQLSELAQTNRIKVIIPELVLAATIVYSLVAEKDYNFALEPLAVSRKIYGTNPFPEAVEIGAYIQKQTSSKDKIAILGSEPEILFYADRLSATGHIYMYGLMEDNQYAEKMQSQLINEIESNAPAFIVVAHNSASWLLRPNSINNVLDWGDSYIPLRYDEVGLVEIFNDKPALFHWGNETAGYEPKADSFVSVFKRRW